MSPEPLEPQPRRPPAGKPRGRLGSIRYRIMVPYLLLVVALVGGTGMAAARWAGAKARQQEIERGRGIAETLRRSRFPLTVAVLGQLRGLGGAEFALLGPDGRVGSSTAGGLGAEGPILAGRLAARGSDLGFNRSWRLAEVDYRVAVVDRSGATGVNDPGRLLILLPERALRAAAWEARRAVLAFSLVGAVLAALLATWIGQSLVRPLSAIHRAVLQVGRGDLRPSGLPRRRDEIGELAQGVDRMARWLRRLRREQARNVRLRLIRQLSAGLAHELRNPLTAARMTVQLYIERNRDRDTEPLRIALDELARAERHVRRFLQVTRPDPPRLQPVAVGPLLERCGAGLEAEADHRGVRLVVEGEPDPPVVHADPEQLGQVLGNLARNAIDAAGPGGEVRLFARTRPGGLAEIVVEDDGPGIAPEHHARLFQPFFTTRPEGVGLGLALSRALVREQGGTIAHRRDGDRTVFVVAFPTSPHAAPRARPEPPGTPEPLEWRT